MLLASQFPLRKGALLVLHPAQRSCHFPPWRLSAAASGLTKQVQHFDRTKPGTAPLVLRNPTFLATLVSMPRVAWHSLQALAHVVPAASDFCIRTFRPSPPIRIQRILQAPPPRSPRESAIPSLIHPKLNPLLSQPPPQSITHISIPSFLFGAFCF